MEEKFEKSHQKSLKLERLMNRARASPCEDRNQEGCTEECEWVPGSLWGGSCKPRNLYFEYINTICDPELLGAAYQKTVKRMARHLGYAPGDFGRSSWKDVSKRELCRKINQDAGSVLENQDRPWTPLGLSQGAYQKLLGYAKKVYDSSPSFDDFYEKMGKYITKERIAGALAAGIVILALFVSMYGSPLARTEESTGLQRFKGREVSVKTLPGIATTKFEPSVVVPSQAANSILDYYQNFGGEIEVVPFSDVTTLPDFQKSIAGASRFLEDSKKCGLGRDLEIKYINAAISSLKSARSSGRRPTEFLDFRDWGLIPGQQIFYGGAFGISGLTHHGIYVGDGLVVEVGAGPQSCKKVARSVVKFKDQMYGLNTLDSFARRAIKQKSEVGIISTPEDANFDVIIERLERAKEIMGCWDYNVLFNNCQSAANFVSFGVRRTAQGELVEKSVVIFLGTALLLAVNRYWSKLARHFYGKELPEKV